MCRAYFEGAVVGDPVVWILVNVLKVHIQSTGSRTPKAYLWALYMCVHSYEAEAATSLTRRQFRVALNSAK